MGICLACEYYITMYVSVLARKTMHRSAFFPFFPSHFYFCNFCSRILVILVSGFLFSFCSQIFVIFVPRILFSDFFNFCSWIFEIFVPEFL
jgi:hypothetical protein